MRSEPLQTQELLLRRTLPLIINSFNQFTYLKNLLTKLDRDQFKNIIIVDNDSKYDPLLSYYEELNAIGQVAIIFYGENKGPHFFHMKGVYKLFGSLPHLYTDPDLDYDELAPNFLTELMTISEKYSMFKVGPALEIPSPDEIDNNIYCVHEARRWTIAEWEQQFWRNQIEEGLYYPGQIDTTFQLFNPKYFTVGSELIDGIRIGKPGFRFKHLPWYSHKGYVPKLEQDFYSTTSSQKNTWKSC